jgi:hypothetical protein
MKIIHGDGFTEAELKSYKPIICDNLIHSMRAVLEAMGALQINLADQVRLAKRKREREGGGREGREGLCGGSCLFSAFPKCVHLPYTRVSLVCWRLRDSCYRFGTSRCPRH